MADYGTLFTLILVALTFVVVGMIFIVYIMIIGEREKKVKAEGEPAAEEKAPEAECPHGFGYLSDYPRNQPIPEECFGCLSAIQCVNQKTQAAVAEVTEPVEQQ